LLTLAFDHQLKNSNSFWGGHACKSAVNLSPASKLQPTARGGGWCLDAAMRHCRGRRVDLLLLHANVITCLGHEQVAICLFTADFSLKAREVSVLPT